MANEALLRKAQADNVIERAALQLKSLLAEACAELDPFPSFPNAFFTSAIEADPGSGGRADLGCIVVMQDGELYELEMGIDHESIELTGSYDPVTARKETVKKIDLHPRDYLIYAYNALLAVTDAILEREAEAGEKAGDA